MFHITHIAQRTIGRLGLSTLFALVLLAAGAAGAGSAHAEGPVTASVTAIDNKWPDQVDFTAQAASTAGNVRTLTLHLIVGSGPNERYLNVDITPGPSVEGQATLKTGGSNFVVAGADITYWLEAQDTAGNKTVTDKKLFWYADTRFDWKSVSDGNVTVYYYRNAEPTARELLTAAKETENKTGALLGTKGRPFKVMLYNAPQEIIPAQSPQPSQTVAASLIRVGIAYAGEDVVQVLSTGTAGARETAHHEITHLFEHWVAGNNLPAWLDEGMAVWGQDDPGREYLGALQTAIRNNSLLLIRATQSFPGKPDETILAYGQSYSVVKYLIDTYGGDKYRRLYELIKANGTDNALKEVYGLTVDELDAKWRESLGVPPRSYETVAPTPISIGEIQPIGAVSSDGSSPSSSSNTAGGSSAAGAPASTPPFILVGAVAAVVILVVAGGGAIFAVSRKR